MSEKFAAPLTPITVSISKPYVWKGGPGTCNPNPVNFKIEGVDEWFKKMLDHHTPTPKASLLQRLLQWVGISPRKSD
jgi:hypothetical protein